MKSTLKNLLKCFLGDGCKRFKTSHSNIEENESLFLVNAEGMSPEYYMHSSICHKRNFMFNYEEEGDNSFWKYNYY